MRYALTLLPVQDSVIPFFCVIIAGAALALALACAINFFWRTGFARALEPAGLLVGAILLFWISGLWDGASRHSWGVLGPLFLLLAAFVWVAARIAWHLLRRLRGG